MREPLTLRDLAGFADMAAAGREPRALFAAAEALVGRVVGHTLFTVTRVLESGREVQRIHTSNPRAYPVGGRKPKPDTPWSRTVLSEGRVFVARTPEEIRAAFPDHALIESLGIGSIMNVPISCEGRRVGVMNVSHVAHWFTPADEEIGRVVAALLGPACLPGAGRA